MRSIRFGQPEGPTSWDSATRTSLTVLMTLVVLAIIVALGLGSA